MSSIATSVVSAAVIGGDLVLGLSDGSIINCGRVQGPQGLKGDQGPMGATGRAGTDGNTIHTVAGAPDTTLGRDGDYAINTTVWEIYGPRAGGAWGTGTPLRGNRRNGSGEQREAIFGQTTDTGGGGGAGLQQILGGAGITATPQTNPKIIEISANVDTAKGLEIVGDNIAINIGDGLEFDAASGKLKTAVDLDTLATTDYVDQKTERLPYLLETDAVGGATPFSSSAAIQLADNKGDITSVKITGLNGIGISADVDGINVDGAALTGDISLELDNYATKEYSDGKDDDLQNQIDMLTVQKGAAANYDCKSVSGSYNCRPGDAAFDNEDANLVTVVGLGSEDKSGILTKTVQVGDIIEYVSPSGADTRFRAVDVTGYPIYMAVEFVSGGQTFVENVQYTVYIYPQNEAGPTKDYVDSQDALKVNKAGDEMKGLLVMDTGSSYETAIQVKAYGGSPGTRVTTLQIGSDGKINSSHLIKTTRNNGYAFEVKPDDATTVSYLHTNGTFKLGGTGEILGDVDITTESGTGVRILGPLKVKATNQTIGGTNVFEVFDSEAKYNGAISSDNNLATKKYVDDNAGGGVEDYTGGSSPPATRDRGTMLITTSNALYIYT